MACRDPDATELVPARAEPLAKCMHHVQGGLAMRRLLAVLACATVVLPAYGQGADLKDLLSGSVYPLSLKLSDLNGEWRRLRVGGSDAGGLMGLYSAMMGGVATTYYYTQGRTVAVSGETYLVAYRPRSKPVDMSAMMRSSSPPTPEKLKRDTVLALSLLCLKTAGSLDDIRPFNLEEEVAESEQAPQSNDETFAPPSSTVSSESNLKQLGMALIMYTQDYDEVLPPMKDPPTVKKLLMPYVKNEAIFAHPTTRKPYVPNAVLSRKKLGHIAKPAEMVAFYEASASSDGKRGVVYLDGHVAQVAGSDWPRVKRASKIP